MTTKIRIEIVQENVPVVVEVLRGDGAIRHTAQLASVGNAVEEYVHSGQTLRVREMTTQEVHNLNAIRYGQEDDPQAGPELSASCGRAICTECGTVRPFHQEYCPAVSHD